MFCGGRGNRGAVVEKGRGPWQRNIFVKNSNYYFWGREVENKRR
jgi:hypothetical protein